MGDGYPSDWDSRRRRGYRRDNYRCQRCGRSGGPRGNAELHAHHKTPKSRGGSHELHNLTT
ncbi:HNH endonuclease, partial [Halobacterium hubeiense]